MISENIIQLFIKAAGQFPERGALVQESHTVSFADLLRDVKCTAALYSSRGIKKGDKVLVFLPMSIDLYRVVLALFHIGACPVFLDEWVSVKRLKACCDVVPCQAIIATPKLNFLSFFIGVLRRIKTRIDYKATAASADIEPTEVDATDTALITFTTGSTGIPKAANRTHGFLHAQYAALRPLLRNHALVALVTLPIVVLINLAMGKTTVLPPRKFSIKKKDSVKKVVAQLSEQKVEELICSPSLLQMMLDDPALVPGHVHYVFTGGGPVFPDTAARLVSVFKNAHCMIVYGSTEAEPVSHINAAELADVSLDTMENLGLPVGLPGEHVKLAIIPHGALQSADITDADFFDACITDAQAGELLVTGDHVLKDYINNPAAIRLHKLKTGGRTWHRTGDIGRLADGQLYLLGSASSVFEYKGRVYYPFVCDYLLRRIVGVRQAAVLLHHDKPLIVLQARSIDAQQLQEAKRRLLLEDAKVKYVASIPTDPRHHTKIDYEALRKLLK